MPPWPWTSKSGIPRTTPNADASRDEETVDYITSKPVDGAGIHDYVHDSPDELERPIPPFANEGSPQTNSPHTRSHSNTIFGIKKRTPSNFDTPAKNSPNNDDGEGTPGPSSPRRTPGVVKNGDDEFETGTCPTCASMVKWPKNVSEYRCAICAMVSDLGKVNRRRQSPRKPDYASANAGIQVGPDVERQGWLPITTRETLTHNMQASPLSLERTQSIINQCIDRHLTELRQRMDTKSTTFTPTSLSRKRADSPTLSTPSTPRNAIKKVHVKPETHGPKTVEQKNRGRSTSGPGPCEVMSTTSQAFMECIPARPLRDPPAPPMTTPMHTLPRKKSVLASMLTEPSVAPRNTEEVRPIVRKTIFKQLENYIINSITNYESLNRSFSSVRPRHRPMSRSVESVPTREIHKSTGYNGTFDPQNGALDPRLLMIGDVAENGSWWAGRTEHAAGTTPRNTSRDDGPSDAVSSRSPHISGLDVSRFYDLIIRAGLSWRERWAQLEAAEQVTLELLPTTAARIEDAFLEARVHVQKTLLKACESMLKRPGKPLKLPSDTRFLFLILANPLLYPITASQTAFQAAKDLTKLNKMSTDATGEIANGDPASKANANSQRLAGYWEQGYANGLLKRIFGMMSNLSNDCHRYISSWLARMSEKRFRELVELVQSFVTYRLGRRHSRKMSHNHTLEDFIPQLSGTGLETSAELHAALGLGSQSKSPSKTKGKCQGYSEDWQIKGAARFMALLFSANRSFLGERMTPLNIDMSTPGSISRQNAIRHGQLLSISDFYNLRIDGSVDLVVDFDSWESSSGRFSFCGYPFFLSVGSKIRIMQHDAIRQQNIKAREAFFNSILKNQTIQQYITLRVRRDCLVEDSLREISEAVGQGQDETKKALRVEFIGEEGIDAGGLRKEWFLLLVREIFDPDHGMFVYDDESNFCYFNPHSFETSDQYFLVGALLGLAIYNSTILDVALPPFLFKKLLAAGMPLVHQNSFTKASIYYTIEDLAEFRPTLAQGLRQLLEFKGDVQETYVRDFVADVSRYGSVVAVPLCSNGENRPVTNSNRQEFVDAYVKFLLDQQVARQFEPFKRGFFSVCGGNALSLFQPEEIELLIRGSDEQLDVPSLKAVAIYENWKQGENKIVHPEEEVDVVKWFWEWMLNADAKAQRKVLGFITGSDRLPALGTTSLVIKVVFAGKDFNRFPIARTCFNSLLLYDYRTKDELADRLWRAVCDSEGFGLK